MTNKQYYPLIQKAIEGFLDYHGIPHKELILHTWISEDIATHRPSDLIPIKKMRANDEYGGMQIQFMSEKIGDNGKNVDIPIRYFTAFRELMSRMMFHSFPYSYLPEHVDPSEPNNFDEDLTESTCWHHCSLTWAQFSDGYQIKIQVGYCTCS
jgi:hypothetical protein